MAEQLGGKSRVLEVSSSFGLRANSRNRWSCLFDDIQDHVANHGVASLDVWMAR